MGSSIANKGSFSSDPNTGRKPLGRPAGVPNKYAIVKNTILKVFEDLQQDPIANLFEWAVTNPTEFYKIASKILPLEIEAVVKQTITVKLLDDDEDETEDAIDNGFIEYEEVEDFEDYI